MPKDIKYVGPIQEVENPVAEPGWVNPATGLPIVRHGDVITVSDEHAGRPPKGDRFNKDGSLSKTYDPGDGLLAQPDVWAEVKSKRSADA